MTVRLKLDLPTTGASVGINPATGKPPRRKMAPDFERCIGCHECSVACKVENSVPLGRCRKIVYYWERGELTQGRRHSADTDCAIGGYTGRV